MQQAVNEIQGLYLKQQPLLGSTEASYSTLGRIAAAAWPLLLSGDAPELNQGIVALTKPYPAIRANDRKADAGQPTEPIGWDVQAVHALALGRVGKLDEALRENRALAKKIEVNVKKGRLPDARVHFMRGDRSQKSLLRQAILQEAFILACGERHAQSAAVAARADRVDVNKSTVEDERFVAALVAAISKIGGNRDDRAGTERNQPDKAQPDADVRIGRKHLRRPRHSGTTRLVIRYAEAVV